MAFIVNIAIGKSKFTLAVLGGVACGIFFADKIFLGFAWEIGLIIGLLIGLILFWQSKVHLLVIVSFLSFFLGLAYYHFWDLKESKKVLLYDTKSSIAGQVISKPELTNKQKFLVSYKKTKILVETEKYPEYYYGDVLKIEGLIKDPKKIETKKNFNYGSYLLKKGIRGQILNPEKIEKIGVSGNVIVKEIYEIGARFGESINKSLSEPYAAFQSGILLGEKRNIPDSLMSQFNITGTTHIVAVSGYNLTVIIWFLSFFLMRFSRKVSFFGSLAGICFFVILTGAVSSVLRAGILMALVLFARFIGRRPYYPVLILFCADLMLLFNPYALKNDVSFQLSFLAFIGLVYISPIIETSKISQKIPKNIRLPFSETVGAQMAVLPILLFNFGILSLVAPLTNILILAFVPFSMLFGFVTGIGGMVYSKLGEFFGVFSWLILKYILLVTDWFSKVPLAAIKITATEWWWIPIYYYLLYLWIKNRNKQKELSNALNLKN